MMSMASCTRPSLRASVKVSRSCEASMPCTGSNRPVGVPLALADGATDAEGAASTCAAAGAFTGVAATVGCGAGWATATG
ncbi:hypothetical protein G6F31_019260 [Rhizopus arrhizus]|nr:hypothetical protein G6F31_019260 [Rhizopus arrhizus]